MKRLLILLSCSGLLSACALLPFHTHQDAAATVVAKPVLPTRASDGSALVGIDGVTIEKVEFRPGISSATVENLAKQRGCTSAVGAGLVSQPGPVEVYRMACENGSVFLAKCELRQCKAMTLAP